MGETKTYDYYVALITVTETMLEAVARAMKAARMNIIYISVQWHAVQPL